MKRSYDNDILEEYIRKCVYRFIGMILIEIGKNNLINVNMNFNNNNKSINNNNSKTMNNNNP